MTPRPPILPPALWSFPQPEVTVLDTGMAVWAYDLPGQLICSCDLVLELPLNAEPEGLDGVGTIAVRALDEGTRAHPGTEFAKALEATGAQFDGLAGMSTTQCLLDLPYDGLSEGLSLLAEAVSTPAYDEKDVNRIKANRLAEIEQQESRGSFQASTALRRALLADRLRISRPAGGSWDCVEAVRPSDVSAFHDARYCAEGATLIIAGDLSGIDAPALAGQAFGNWNPASVPVPAEPASPAGSMRRQLIHREGAVQADVRLGWYGIDRHDPRWPGLQVAMAVMGGMFNSRLNTVLREERGYTYGVSMHCRPFRSGGVIDMAASTRTSTAGDLIAEAVEILHAAPFTQDEVDQAIGYLTLSAPLSLDTAEAVASQAATLAAARLDVDYVTKSLAALRDVTPQSAMEAFSELVAPDEASIIVVADSSEAGSLGLNLSER